MKLEGELPDWVSAKDVILEMLRRYGVKGCVGKIVEYYGPGVKNLSATDRETIGNMGAELGATSSIFPSDENTRAYLEAQGRGGAWVELAADEGAAYDEYDEIDLSTLEPLIACPSSPGNVVPVRKVAGIKVDQVIVGSSVNSSFRDLMVVAKMMEGRHCHPETSLNVNPGSRQVLENVVAQSGAISLMRAGARIHEAGCLGCIGMGQAPGTGQVSLRTFPRNFPGRSGTKDDRVYLCSPETSAAAALKGVITDPRDLAKEMDYPRIQDPARYLIDETSILFPTAELRKTIVVRGPNIKPLPQLDPSAGNAWKPKWCSKLGTISPPIPSCPPATRSCPCVPTLKPSANLCSRRSTRILPRNAKKKEGWSSSPVKITGRDPAGNMPPWGPGTWGFGPKSPKVSPASIRPISAILGFSP